MHSFDVINLAASPSLLPRLVKAEIIVFEGNQTLLEKSRVVMWLEIGCLIHDVILCFRIFFFFRRFHKIAENNFYLCRVCPSVCPHGKTQLPPDRISWNLMFVNFLENLCIKLKYHWNLTRITRNLHADRCTVMTKNDWILLRIRNVLDRMVEKIETILCSITSFFFSENPAF